MSKAKILHKNPDMVTRVIGDETILLPIYKSSDDMNCIYTLNTVASRIWEMIDGHTSFPAMKKQILEEFDTNPAEAEGRLKEFLKELVEIKAVR